MAAAKGQTSGIVTALIYTRVSSDEQAREGLSLPSQLNDCRRYAAAMPGWVLGEEYQDILSGKRDDRRDYQRLLKDVRCLRAEGKRVVVVVPWAAPLRPQGAGAGALPRGVEGARGRDA